MLEVRTDWIRVCRQLSYVNSLEVYNQRVDTVVRVEDNICTYLYGEILHASAVLLKLFMSDRDYMSTGENLYFLFRVCK